MIDPQDPQPISAQMTLWRVFGLLDKFEDQPRPYWSANAAGPRPGSDQLTVMIGEIPDMLLTALKQWRAQAAGMLNVLTGHPTTYEELLAMYKTNWESMQVPEFEKAYVAWLTFRLDRSVEIMSDASELSWIAGAESAVKAMESFAEEGGRFMDCAVARVIGSAEGLNIRRLRFADRRPYLTAEGKAAISIPRTELKVKDSGLLVGRNDGWDVAPTGQIVAAISAIPSARIDYKLIGQPTSWLCSAMAEEEDDLRRFTFAYAGLELLATQVEKANRGKLIARIESLDNTLPVVELLWPSSNEDFAWRNLVFRFAAMATLYSPVTVLDDVQTFKQIAKARNDLYHGTEQVITRALSISCEELLRKYVGYVAAGLPDTGSEAAT
jgi:hypothetical protein